MWITSVSILHIVWILFCDLFSYAVKDSPYNLATGLAVRHFRTFRGKRLASSRKRPNRLRGPPNLQFHGYRSSFQDLKQPWRYADFSPPSIAEVKNNWSYTSTPLCAFKAWTGTTVPSPYLTQHSVGGTMAWGWRIGKDLETSGRGLTKLV